MSKHPYIILETAVFRIIAKRPATLLEVLIAMALTVLILMTLTFFYRQVVEIDVEVDKIMSNNFKMRYVESRLANILPRIVSKDDKEQDFVFFSVGDEGLTKPGSQSLIFTFDNEVSLDKELSNHVLSRLYVDKGGNLMMAYWPSPKRWKEGVLPVMKKEVLMEGVDNLTFEFFIAPDKTDKKSPQPNKNLSDEKDTKKQDTETQQQVPEPKGEWRLQPWLSEFKQLPVMIRVVITLPKQDKPLIFAYPLAKAKEHVIYD